MVAAILFQVMFFTGMAGAGTVTPPHPFYTSVTEVEYNAKEKSLEIVTRIFTDDFENILRRNYNTKVDLFNDAYKNAASLITAYIEKNLKISADGVALKLKYVGHERNNEALWCYFEIPGVNTAPKKIEITNQLLYDYTDKQFNLVHATVNGVRKSTRLNYPDSRAGFEW